MDIILIQNLQIYKKEVLSNVFNKIITTILYIEALQDLIEDSDSKADDYEGSQNNISESNNYTSDKDLNMSAQNPNKYKFHENFHMAKKLLKSKILSSLINMHLILPVKKTNIKKK
ncbi:hypothetical protein F8M41_012759 [Gigaspora margarita]|uniref:Uncharacterized protein n=1 Tax=Gigaspora margarita TaxID=4874 RepID=A0A8H3WYM3_GIGMA|nr:hypothetical protein F8M41_012759 [Gigaspora margarita]